MGYLALLRTRPAYRRLWAAELVSATGDWFSMVAVSIVAARSAPEAGGLALATVLAAHLLPQALLAPVAGWLADRFDRRALLVFGNLAEGVLTAGMTLAAAGGSLVTLQALLFLRSSMASLREPALGAAMPSLVGRGELATANALGAATWSLTFVVGMGLGGVATEIGAPAALAIDAVTFFVASALFRGLPSLAPPRTDAQPAGGRVLQTAIADLRVALVATKRRDLRAAVFGKTPPAVAGGAAWIALNLGAEALPFAGGAAATLGALQAIRGVGTGVGPLVSRGLVARGYAPALVAHACALAAFVGAIGIACVGGPSSAIGSVLLWGAGGGALWVITQTEIQQRSDEAMRGRLLALDALGFTLGMSGSALLTGLLVDSGIALGTVGALVVTASALSWFFVRAQGRAARTTGTGRSAVHVPAIPSRE
ncbi:MAG: MFS transporter [Myxococcales bacterium]|nr:MFS transporter [Myxococcales bacterium]